jgi:hypothetical protein
MDAPRPRKLKFIGCEVLCREACHLAASSPALVDLELLRKGLHDLPRADMQAKLQAAVDAVDPAAGYDAIVLGYARCNDGLVGLTARTIPLVLPRAHDCITLFFGSRARYRAWFDAHPGTYYLTSGWMERNFGGSPGGKEGLAEYDRPAYGMEGVMAKLGLTESYAEMVEKYGQEAADFLKASVGDWTKNYDRFLYLTMGVCDESAHLDRARSDAEARGFAFQVEQGDLALLRKLVNGPWDQDFVVVPPGGRIVARDDELVLDVATAE